MMESLLELPSLLTANHLTSIAAIVGAWWLVHAYAVAGFPDGRRVAIAWSLLGLLIAITAFARHFSIGPEWLIVATKCVLTYVEISHARRLGHRRQMVDDLMKDPIAATRDLPDGKRR